MKKFLIGLVIVSLFLIVPIISSAETTLPSIDDILESNSLFDYAIIVEENGNILLFLLSGQPYGSSYDIVTFNPTNDIAYQTYRLSSNGWKHSTSGTNSRQFNSSDVLWSKTDVYYNDSLIVSGDDVIFEGSGSSSDSSGENTEEDDTSFLQGIIDAIKQTSADFGASLDAVKNFLSESFSNAIGLSTEAITNAIRDIFVPDTSDLQNKLNSFVSQLASKFDIDTTAFENLFNNEKPVQNIKGELGGVQYTFVDFTWLIVAVEEFRPIIRGFIVLMLLLYNIRQLIGFFGYDAGVVAGRNEKIAEAKKG